MNRRLAGASFAFVVLVATLGVAHASFADTGVIRVMIAGAFSSPTGTSGDGQVTLRIGVGLPVFLVSGTTVVPGSLGTSTFAQWTDTLPTTGFGPSSNLMVFHLGGSFMVVAGGVATPGGFVTTFSATAPAQTLSGTWTMTTGAGLTGATANDAVVTFAYDTNPSIAVSGSVTFVAGGAVTALTTKPIPALGNVDVLRNIPVFQVVSNAKDGQVATLMSHSAYGIVGHSDLDFLELKAISFGGGLYLIYGCAFPDAVSSIACLAGGTAPVAHLSGSIFQLAGILAKSTIAGVVDADLALILTGALP
jgi:hypothetical protein